MKKLFTSLSLVIVLSFAAKAQTPEVKITYNFDSTFNFQCSPPVNAYTMIGGHATGINAVNDSLVYLFSWGDGSFSADTLPFNISGTNTYWYIPYGFHTYTASGIFDLKLVVGSKLTGAKDSLVIPNYRIIGTHCDSITGNFYKDVNNDCQFNSGEPLMNNPPSMLKIYSGNTILNNFYYNQQNGHFSLNVPAGIPGMPPYKIKLNNTAAFSAICPANGEYIIPNLPSLNNNFGFQCNEYSDFGFGFILARVAFSNFKGQLFFNVANLSCNTGVSIVKIILDPKTHLGMNSSPMNSSVILASTGDTVVYNNVSLNTFTTQYFQMNLTAVSSINLGDTLKFKAMIIPQSNEINHANNFDTIMIRVVASYDPNDIQVSPFGFIPNLTKLNYSIRFQNTGNAPASKVVIIDTLDVNLDINTLIFKGSSHDVDMVKLPNNIVKLVFDPIYLPDSGLYMAGSMGYVAFSIKPTGYLPLGTQITNTASIYFDENPAIQTNTVINIIDSVQFDPDGILERMNEQLGIVYPNPATDFISVSFDDELKNASVSIFDMNGRVVIKQACNEKTFQIPLQSIESGIYLIQLQNKGYLKQQKLTICR